MHRLRKILPKPDDNAVVLVPPQPLTILTTIVGSFTTRAWGIRDPAD
jgi:hypothetical protein